eukprot:3767691-Pleurochrysis_carterae.AAC.1
MEPGWEKRGDIGGDLPCVELPAVLDGSSRQLPLFHQHPVAFDQARCSRLVGCFWGGMVKQHEAPPQ